MDALAKHSAGQATETEAGLQKQKKTQPLADSEVLSSAIRDKVVSFEKVAHCRVSPLQFCLNHSLIFLIKLFVKHCKVLLLLWGLARAYIMNLLACCTVNHKV